MPSCSRAPARATSGASCSLMRWVLADRVDSFAQKDAHLSGASTGDNWLKLFPDKVGAVCSRVTVCANMGTTVERRVLKLLQDEVTVPPSVRAACFPASSCPSAVPWHDGSAPAL